MTLLKFIPMLLLGFSVSPDGTFSMGTGEFTPIGNVMLNSASSRIGIIIQILPWLIGAGVIWFIANKFFSLGKPR